MAFKAYAFNLNQEQENTIQRMAAVVTNDLVEIIDLMCYKPHCNQDDIIFLYGKRTHRAFENIQCKYRLEFPELSTLTDKKGNSDVRQHAFQTLLDLKEKLTKGELESAQTSVEKIVLTPESLPQISTDEILLLQQDIIVKKQEYWQGINKQGNSIRLTVEPSTSDADINMTFAELYTIKLAMETLGLKEVQIVPNPKRTS